MSTGHHYQSECDISVLKLIGFETFPIFWMVSDSVLKKFGIEKSIGFGIKEIWYRTNSTAPPPTASGSGDSSWLF